MVVLVVEGEDVGEEGDFGGGEGGEWVGGEEEG